jgi:hypothetical protein
VKLDISNAITDPVYGAVHRLCTFKKQLLQAKSAIDSKKILSPKIPARALLVVKAELANINGRYDIKQVSNALKKEIS